MLETSGPLHPLQGDVRLERDLAGHPGEPGMYCIGSGMVLTIGDLAGAHVRYGGRSVRGVVALRAGPRQQRPEPRATPAKAVPPGFDVELRPGPLEVLRVRDPLVLSEQPSGSGSHLKIGDGYGVIGQDLL